MKIINPATHEVITDITPDSPKEITQKYEQARLAQKHWASTSLDQRLDVIQKFNEILDIKKEEMSKTLSQETGKPLQEAINEINGGRFRTRFFIENTKEWLSPDEVNKDDTTTEVLTYEPLGVVCNISAWNYPLLVGVNVFIPALLAGNAVLYKPSEFSTMTGLLIEKYLHEAGVPQDVFITIKGERQAGEALLDLPCDGYFFTGSYKTGKYIAQKVAPKLVPVGLELGGKDPLYVTDQTDISKTAASVAEGCFYNNGQSCCAVERVYVHEKIYDDFIEKFVEESKKMSTGPVTRGQHLAFLEEQVQDAVKKGAEVLTGGKPTGKGNYFPPTVLVNVDHTMSLMKEETFGPVIGVMKVKSDDEAINLMNDTDYGLTASVYCNDTKRAQTILSQVESGTSYINCCDRVSPYLPWSGRNNSGLGSTLSYLGILAFVKPRAWQVRLV
ncbi:MAG: aldehyde dehydrogenase family protein [Bacteriovoracia bacterium]